MRPRRTSSSGEPPPYQRLHVHARPDEVAFIDAAAAGLNMSRSQYMLRSAMRSVRLADTLSRQRRAAMLLASAAKQALEILDGDDEKTERPPNRPRDRTTAGRDP